MKISEETVKYFRSNIWKNSQFNSTSNYQSAAARREDTVESLARPVEGELPKKASKESNSLVGQITNLLRRQQSPNESVSQNETALADASDEYFKKVQEELNKKKNLKGLIPEFFYDKNGNLQSSDLPELNTKDLKGRTIISWTPDKTTSEKILKILTDSSGELPEATKYKRSSVNW